MVGLDRDNVLNGGFEKNDHYVLFFSGMVVFPLLSQREVGEKIYGFRQQNYIKSLEYPRKKRGMTFKWMESNLRSRFRSAETNERGVLRTVNQVKFCTHEYNGNDVVVINRKGQLVRYDTAPCKRFNRQGPLIYSIWLMVLWFYSLSLFPLNRANKKDNPIKESSFFTIHQTALKGHVIQRGHSSESLSESLSASS